MKKYRLLILLQLILTLSCSPFTASLESSGKVFEYLNRATQYENLTSFEIASSELGADILCYKLSKDNTPRPNFLLIGGIHGNERASTFFLVNYIDYLLVNSLDTQVSQLLENANLYFLPIANPDGFDRLRRNNSNNVDLNRNFSWAWSRINSTHGEQPFDQAESLAIKQLVEANNFSLILAFHTGQKCISFLWDYIGKEESKGSPATYSEEEFIANYLPEYPFISTIADNYESDVDEDSLFDEFYATLGYDWYPVFGSMQDWFYGEHGILNYTIEISNIQNSIVTGKEMENLFIFSQHHRALSNLLETGLTGLHCRITKDGLPIEARVLPLRAGSRGFSDPVEFETFSFSDKDGYLDIVLEEGEYNLLIEFEGQQYEVLNIDSRQFSDSYTLIEI
ncbi:MAG: DUF2817 domain-containing protein [Spirochaetales bacterium]|nr:DUF2817 domain-containing protein [Spirochaetales bacterium]